MIFSKQVIQAAYTREIYSSCLNSAGHHYGNSKQTYISFSNTYRIYPFRRNYHELFQQSRKYYERMMHRFDPAFSRKIVSSLSSPSNAPKFSDLCIFPSAALPLPTSTGALNIFDPKYLQMLDVIVEVGLTSKSMPRFGCFPKTSLVFTGTKFPDGIDEVGCCCLVDKIQPNYDGSQTVDFSVTRRFQIRSILRQAPFLVATVEWIDDADSQTQHSGSDPAVDRLEHSVWEALKEVASLEHKLNRIPETMDASSPFLSLPSSVHKYAPEAPASPPIFPTGVAEEISVWKSMQGGQNGRRRKEGNIEGEGRMEAGVEACSDPYWVAKEWCSKPFRQEAFSFASAAILDIGYDERKLLLSIRDTGVRLAWVMDAIKPYLATLKAKVAVMNILE